MITFDEFHAVRQRRRHRHGVDSSPREEEEEEEEEKEDVFKVVAKRKASTTEAGKRYNAPASSVTGGGQEKVSVSGKSSRRSSSGSLGNMMELQEAQVLMIAIIFSDIAACVVELVFLPELEKSALTSLLARFLQSFSGFSTIFGVLELLALFFSFRVRLFGHIGYVMDGLILGLQVAHHLGALSSKVRLLGVLRFWRLLRLINTMSSNAQVDVAKARKQLQRERELSAARMDEVSVLMGRLKAEEEARQGTELMLQSYKDEVDTLKEALKIAANDIAEAALEDDMEGDFSGEGSDEEEDGVDQGRVHYEAEKKVRRDAAAARSASRIIVNDDGTWEK